MIRLRVHIEFLKMSLSNDEYSYGDSNRVADRQKVVEIPENHREVKSTMFSVQTCMLESEKGLISTRFGLESLQILIKTYRVLVFPF